MRFSTVATMLAGAGLAMQVGASPIRIVFVSETPSNTSAVPSPGEHKPFLPPHLVLEGGKRRGGCGGGRPSLANKFRHLFGLPPIEPEHHHRHPGPWGPHHPGEHPPPPPPFPPHMPGEHHRPHHHDEDGEPVWLNKEHRPEHEQEEEMMEEISSEDILEITPVRKPMGARPHPHHRHPHHRPHGPPSFLRRIHFSLMSLGPWEGRAVAFVLGCGLGVLIRMLWVLTIVLYRAVRGQRAESDEYEELFDQDAEEILVAPPQYTTYSDEKKSIVVPVPASQ